MSKLIRPSTLSLNASKAGALTVGALYVPTGPVDVRNLVGGDTLTHTVPAYGKFSAGPGGMGAQFTAGVYESFDDASGTNAPPHFGDRATFFGIASFPSLPSNQTVISCGSSGTSSEIRINIDSTNGFRSCMVNASFVEVDMQSIGSAPALNTPIAFVVRMSGSSHANLRSIHTSDGKSVSGTASETTYNPLSLTRSAATIGGPSLHSGINGHVYQFGWARRLWSDEEITQYLNDPWLMLRPPSLLEVFGSMFTTAGAPEIAVFGNGIEIADGSTTTSLSNHTDFGSSPHGGGGVTRMFDVQNTGTALLNITGVTLPLGFQILDGLPLSILAGGSDYLTIQALTSVPGTYSGDIEIESDDANEGVYSFRITSAVVETMTGGAGGGGTLSGALNGAQVFPRSKSQRRKR